MEASTSSEQSVGHSRIVLGSDVVFATSPTQSLEAAWPARHQEITVTEAWQQISTSPATQLSLSQRSAWGRIIVVDEQIVQSQQTLSERVQHFKASVTAAQNEQLLRQQADVEQILADIQTRQDAKEEKGKNKKVWVKKLNSGLEAFRETAVHYQKILDVINAQAPEYTTPVWGALKLILLVSTNKADLKEGVEQHLKTIAHQFKIMQALVDLNPTKTTADAVIEVYGGFLAFLGEALKYYNENKFIRGAKAFAKPWETRFKDLVAKIEHGVKIVNQVANLSHMADSKNAFAGINQMLVGQQRTERRESVIYHTIGRGFQELLNSNARGNTNIEQCLRELREAVAMLPISENESSLSRKALQGLLESSQPKKIYEKEAESLAAYTLKNKVKEFRDKLFPVLTQTERDFGSFFAVLRPRPADHYGNFSKLQNNPEILSWLQACNSGILWIEGYVEKSDPYWNSTFALEVFCAAEKGACEDPTSITALSFFCDEKAHQDLNRPEIIAQSLLIELIEKHRTRFNHDICFERQLTSHRFEDVVDDCSTLWKLFEECLAISQTRCLYLVIDNIDVLFSQYPDKSGKSHHLLEQLEKLTETSGLVVKILLTSRSPRLSRDLFTNENPNRLVVSLPRGGMQRVAGHTRKSEKLVRLPIEGSTKEKVIGHSELLENGTIEGGSEPDEDIAGTDESSDEDGSSLDDSMGDIRATQYSRYLDGPIDDSSSSEQGEKAPNMEVDGAEGSDDDSDKNSLFEALHTRKGGVDIDDSSDDSKSQEPPSQDHQGLLVEGLLKTLPQPDGKTVDRDKGDEVSDSDSDSSLLIRLRAKPSQSKNEGSDV